MTDRLYCLLLSVENELSIGRLNCYMYILQKLGFRLDYSFRLNVSGVRSKNFARFLEEQVAMGVVLQKSGIISLTQDSRVSLENTVLSLEEILSSEKIKFILDNLSDDELHLVCIVDMIIEDVIKSKGVDSLITSRKFIENSVSNLCSAYSEENFNLAISLIRRLKKECMLDE